MVAPPSPDSTPLPAVRDEPREPEWSPFDALARGTSWALVGVCVLVLLVGVLVILSAASGGAR